MIFQDRTIKKTDSALFDRPPSSTVSAMKRGITTGQGDQGHTRLLSGLVVSKNNPWTEVLGDLDELNSQLGWARTQVPDQDTASFILHLQEDLIQLSARLDGAAGKHRPDLDDEIAYLETAIHRHNDNFEMPQCFIHPGASQAGAALDVCRSVARRAERHLVAALTAAESEDTPFLVWINRLSDLLWLMARCEDARPE